MHMPLLVSIIHPHNSQQATRTSISKHLVTSHHCHGESHNTNSLGLKGTLFKTLGYCAFMYKIHNKNSLIPKGFTKSNLSQVCAYLVRYNYSKQSIHCHGHESPIRKICQPSSPKSHTPYSLHKQLTSLTCTRYAC